MESKEMICIVCPIGCKMTLIESVESENGFVVSGNKCNRGPAYAVKEMTNPTRVLTTTVAIEGAHIERMPVKSSAPLPKGKLMEAMAIINTTNVAAPLAAGDVILKDILNTGVDILASRSMKRI